MIKIIRESNGELMGVLKDDESAYPLCSEVEELRSEVEHLRKIVSSKKSLGSKVYRFKAGVVEAVFYDGVIASARINSWIESKGKHFKCYENGYGHYTYLQIVKTKPGSIVHVNLGDYVVFDGIDFYTFKRELFERIFEEII